VHLGWLGSIVYLFLSDNPEQQLTFKDLDQSERIASFALLINAAVSVCLGILFPWVVSKNWISIKNMFTFSLGVLSLTLMSTYFIQNTNINSTYIIMAIVDIRSVCSTWIPFTLIGKYIEIEKFEVIQQQRSPMDTEEKRRVKTTTRV
jgi:Na+/melibiose symporter-like transporter